MMPTGCISPNRTRAGNKLPCLPGFRHAEACKRTVLECLHRRYAAFLAQHFRALLHPHAGKAAAAARVTRVARARPGLQILHDINVIAVAEANRRIAAARAFGLPAVDYAGAARGQCANG